METSRDDFVIAIRSAFLKKGNKQRFSLIGLIFFSVILIFLTKINFIGIKYLKKVINEVVFRSSFIVSVPEKYIKYSYNSLKGHFLLYEEHQATKKKLIELQSKKYNIDYIVAENKRLKNTLNDPNYLSNEQIAKVLIDKKSPFLRSIIINKGSTNNIKKGMSILNNNYLVGKVIEVNFTTSRVLLLSDLNSKTPVTIEPGSVQAILSGTGKNNGVIQYSKENLKIENDGIVYTSGTGGLYKAGIPIGKVIEINKNKEVIFFSDFSQLRFVKVSIYTEDK